MLPENTKHPNLESAMYNVLIFGSPELTGSCQPLSALPKRPAVGCRNPVKGCGRLPWSAIHSNNFLCFDLQASQASNLREMASFWSQKYSKLAPQCSHYFTVPVPLVHVDFSLPALLFECPYRDLPLWLSSHKFNKKITVHTEKLWRAEDRPGFGGLCRSWEFPVRSRFFFLQSRDPDFQSLIISHLHALIDDVADQPL